MVSKLFRAYGLYNRTKHSADLTGLRFKALSSLRVI